MKMIKNMTTKMMTAALMVAMLATSATAFAADTIDTAGSGATSTAKLTATAATFSVTVPTTLPLSIDQDGAVTESTELKIVNNGDGQVKVTAVEITELNSWTLVDFSDTDFTKLQVNLKQFGLTINGDEVNYATDKIDTLGSAWKTIDGNSELALPYEGNVALQTSGFENTEIATVTFTIGWDSAE